MQTYLARELRLSPKSRPGFLVGWLACKVSEWGPLMMTTDNEEVVAVQWNMYNKVAVPLW